MRAQVVLLLSLSAGLSCGMLPAAADELTVTTYYPKPRAAYGELRVKNDALLAQQGGNVAVGQQGRTGRVPLDINGIFTVTRTLSIAQGTARADPAWGLANNDGRFTLLQQGGVGATGTGAMTVTRSDKIGVGNFSPGAPPKNTLDVKGSMVVGEAYAGQEQAAANGLAVEDRLSIGLDPTETPQQTLEVKGAMVIGSGLAGVETAPGEGLLVENRLGVGLSSDKDPKNTLDVSGPVAIGSAYAALETPAGTDLIVENGIAATSSIVVTDGSLSGDERAFFGQSGAGPVGAGTWNPVAGVAAGAQTGGALGMVLLVSSGPGSNIFTAQSDGKVTAKDTLAVDASTKIMKLMPTASLLIPEGAPTSGAKKLLVSDGSGNASWKSPSAISRLNGPNGSVTPAPARSYNITGSYEEKVVRDQYGMFSYEGCSNAWGTGKCDPVSMLWGSCNSGQPATMMFADWQNTNAMWTVCVE